MRKRTFSFPYLIKAFFFCGFLTLSVLASFSQPKNSKAIVDEVLSQFTAPFPIGEPSFQPEREKIKKKLQEAGPEGFGYLVELAKQAPSLELHRLIPLLSQYQSPQFEGDKIVDLLQVRGGKAKEKFDVLASVPLYANLGFYKPTPKIKNHLFRIVAQKDDLQNNWPVFKDWKKAKKDKETDELEQLIQTGAVLSLFHIQSAETLSFLKEMQTNEELSPELRETIAFYFDKIEKYKTLDAYYAAQYQESPPVE